jgi:hypothetical protein
MYGCQLTFGNVFDGNFTPADVWDFEQNTYLPYLDLKNHNMIWKSSAQSPPSAPAEPPTPGAKQPGKCWWDKYHAAYWWH